MGRFLCQSTTIIDKSGTGISEQDKLLRVFSHQADISLQDAERVAIEDDWNNVNHYKAAALVQAIEQRFGSIENFRAAYQKLDEMAMAI